MIPRSLVVEEEMEDDDDGEVSLLSLLDTLLLSLEAIAVVVGVVLLMERLRP